jgi:signal transduction histidine kinase
MNRIRINSTGEPADGSDKEPRTGARRIEDLSVDPPSISEEVAAEPERPDYNLRIAWSIARYIEDHHGREALEAFAARVGLTAQAFEARNHWVSAATFKQLLSNARQLTGDDQTFMKAVAHRTAELYGPFFWAATPALLFKSAVTLSPFFSRLGRFQMVASGRNFVRLKWTSTRADSRLECLARQAQFLVIPCVWKLPPATLEEHSCIAHGDAACEYHFRWYSVPSWLLSVALFVASALAIVCFAPWRQNPLVWGIPLLLATLARLYEVQRSAAADRETREETTEALRKLVVEEAEARSEIMLLHGRQKEWTNKLESARAEQAEIITDIAQRAEAVDQAREKTLRGFSHDLRNPMTAILFAADYFAENAEALGDEGPAAVKDLETAVGSMRRMLTELMEVATAGQSFVKFVPETIETSVLVDKLGRRLRALVHGRDSIRAQIGTSPSAPETIEIDPLLLDRVLDNLLTNAAKYTEAGSISVELSGDAQTLRIRVSDTGRGIPSDQLARMFESGGSDPSARSADSYGVGLSVVVQLLGSVGGTLDVSSSPGTGTTFVVQIPRVANVKESAITAPAALDDVVHFRPSVPVPSRVFVRPDVSSRSRLKGGRES